MKIRTDFVTNSSSSSFSVVLEFLDSNDEVISCYKSPKERNSGFGLTPKWKKMPECSSVSELCDLLETGLNSLEYRWSGAKRQKFFKENESQINGFLKVLEERECLEDFSESEMNEYGVLINELQRACRFEVNFWNFNLECKMNEAYRMFREQATQNVSSIDDIAKIRLEDLTEADGEEVWEILEGWPKRSEYGDDCSGVLKGERVEIYDMKTKKVKKTAKINCPRDMGDFDEEDYDE